MVWDQIPVGMRFLSPILAGPGANLVSSTMGTGVSFLGVKRLGLGINDSPTSCAGLKKESSYSHMPCLIHHGLL
jgi:hypothetical protein